MRIGFHLQGLRPGLIGGLENYVRNLVEWMPIVDPSVEMVLFGADYNAELLSDWAPRAEVLRWRPAQFDHLDAAALRDYRLDLWFCPLLTLQPTSPGIPTAVMIPDLQHETYPSFFESDVLEWRRQAYAETASAADLVLTLSAFSRDQLIEKLCADPAKTVVTPLAVPDHELEEQEAIESLRARYDLPASFFLYPANPWRHKNHRALFAAMALFRDEEGELPDVVLTGAHPSSRGSTGEIAALYDQLLADQQEWKVGEHVHHLGYVPESVLSCLYREARALVFPSLFEGFGLPVLEAMQAGCPVLTSSATSLPEVGGDAVLYFDPSRPDDLCAAMRSLSNGLGHGVEREQMIARGRRQAARFSWQRCAEQTLDGFARLSRDRPPLISVVTPSFQQRSYLERAINSVLDQDLPEVELIVVDGGSTDGSVELMERYREVHAGRFRYVSEPDRGQAHAVNKGLGMARGEIIGWLNSDDVYEPGALRAVVEHFGEHRSCDLIYGRATFIDGDDNVIGPYPVREMLNWFSLSGECYLCQPAVFWRRGKDDDWRLDESLDLCMDYDLWIRMSRRVEARFIDRVLAGSRVHPGAKTSARRAEVFREIFSTVRRHFGEVSLSWLLGRAHFIAEGSNPTTPPKAVARRSLLLAAAFSLRFNGPASRQWLALLTRSLVGPAQRGEGAPRLLAGSLRLRVARALQRGRWTCRVPAEWESVQVSLEVRDLPESGRCILDCRIGRDSVGEIVVDRYGASCHEVRLPRPASKGSRRLRLRCDSLPTEALRIREVQPLSRWTS